MKMLILSFVGCFLCCPLNPFFKKKIGFCYFILSLFSSNFLASFSVYPFLAGVLISAEVIIPGICLYPILCRLHLPLPWCAHANPQWLHQPLSFNGFQMSILKLSLPSWVADPSMLKTISHLNISPKCHIQNSMKSYFTWHWGFSLFDSGLSLCSFHLLSAHLYLTIHSKPTCKSWNTSCPYRPWLFCIWCPFCLKASCNWLTSTGVPSETQRSSPPRCLPASKSALVPLIFHMLSWTNSAVLLIPVLYLLGRELLDTRNHILSPVSARLTELRTIPDTW